MKNARIIKEIIDNNVIIKSEIKLVGASIARPCSKEHTIADVGAILIARKPQRNCLEHSQTGITLIALVITIIILLILASITINLTLGERGIFNTAKRAVENYKDAEEREFAELNNFEQEMNNTINEIRNNSNTSTTPKQEITKITIEPEKITIKAGETKTIIVSIEPENATNKNVEFISGNADIVTIGEQVVNEDGTISVEITAKVAGSTTIMAVAKDGSNVKGSCNIEVVKEFLFDKEFLSTGATTGSVGVIENQYAGTAGLNISGAPSVGSLNAGYQSRYKWKKEMNLTGYNSLKFYAKKGGGSGFVELYVDEKLLFSVNYSNLPTTWTEYTVNVSELTGVHTLAFVGGYADNSAWSGTSTQYCNIRLIP